MPGFPGVIGHPSDRDKHGRAHLRRPDFALRTLVERACGVGAGGRGASAVDAHGQAHQCRVSHVGFDPACQHHDAGAWTVRAARASARVRRDPARAITAPDRGAHAGSGQKAVGTETSAPPGAGSGGARSTAAARGFKRLILLKALADR